MSEKLLHEAQGRVDRVFSRFSGLDYFKFQGQLRHVHGTVSSGVGVFGTAVMLLLMLSYMAFTTVRWWTEPPTQSTSEYLMGEDEAAPMVPMCFSLPNISDPAYFGIRLYLKRIGLSPDLPSSEPLAFNFTDRNTACLDPNETKAQLKSFCNPDKCAVIRMKLFVCGTNDTDNPYHNNPNVTCAPREAISGVLLANFFSLQFETFLGVIRVNTAPKIELSLSNTILMRMNRRETAPDLFRSFQTTEDTELAVGAQSSSIQYFFGESYPPPHEVIKLELTLDPLIIKTLNTRLTVVDLIGTWGALFGVVGPIFGLYFLRYNEKVFYKANPTWLRINAQCLIEAPEEGGWGEEAEGRVSYADGGPRQSLGAGSDLSPQNRKT
jgi:hypothetical protein